LVKEQQSLQPILLLPPPRQLSKQAQTGRGSELETTNMISVSDFFKFIYEGDEPLTISGAGAKIARQDKVKFGGVTKIDTAPKTQDPKAMDDGKGTKGFDKGNRPNDHRHSVDFPKQGGPSNPVDRNHHLTKMWQNSIEARTNRARKMQRPGQE
jgi:hypothetical protein